MKCELPDVGMKPRKVVLVINIAVGVIRLEVAIENI